MIKIFRREVAKGAHSFIFQGKLYRVLDDITIYHLDRFSGLYGQIKTAAHRVYRADGKRIMVIVEIIVAHIEKQSRKDVWSEYKTEAVYEGKASGYIDGDYELAV